jgi:TonB-dependent receptor
MRILSSIKRVLSLALFVPMIAFGQASLKGTITDASNNETLIGANVIVEGTSLGAATDIEGQFRIVGIPERTFNIKISYVGYEPKILEIDFSKTKDVQKNIQMKPAIIQGEEVVVTAQMRGQLAAINQQLTSNRIVSVVSEEKIKELPDANAAEAIGRLPGVSIIRSGGEATNIVMRGLSSKFSNITIDGVKIPPTDPNSRDVDLSMMSQGALAGIELYKTLTPDQDADAIAGAVNLVTRKAPSERLVRFDIKGGYNYLMKSANQYDLSARYGERFFDDLLGIQLQGNTEKKIRSRETVRYGYGTFDNVNLPSYINNTYSVSDYDNDYNMNRFTVDFTDETRTRNSGKVIFDFNSPDSGSVKLSGEYSETGRDIMLYDRIYPSGSGGFDYNYQYTEQKINVINSSLQGKNFFLDLMVDWNIAFAQSKINSPFGYHMSFQEVNGGTSVTSKDHPELNIIPFANNNFASAVLDSTQRIKQDNFDKEQTYQLNISKKFTFWDISNELKVGAKHKEKTRWMTNDLTAWNNYKIYPLVNVDGSSINLTGTRFERVTDSAPALTYFFDPPAASRDLLGLYRLNPLISKDALKEWWDLNKYGKAGVAQDWGPNGMALLSDYNVTERVTSIYLMNTMNFGQSVTLLYGVRVEKESNDYRALYSDGAVGGTGAVQILNGQVIDTTSNHTETIWLPSAQLSLKPTDYLTLRFAAYKALARPDFNLRLPTFAYGSTNFTIGNPELKDSKAWNFEVNTQVYHNTIGLFSISAFYKIIDDLYHQTNNVNLVWPSGGPDQKIGKDGWTTNKEAGYSSRLDTLLDYLHLSSWKQNAIFSRMIGLSNAYVVNIAYNSPNPSYTWGVEIEHQMNFGFLPITWLRNITLSYNISITRSETNIIISKKTTDSVYSVSGRPPVGRVVPTPGSFAGLTTVPLEDQPELYCNASLGYDIGGFSARISVFYQDRYTRQFSFDGTSDRIVDAFTKWDLALKQQLTSNVSLFLNVENLFNNIDSRSRLNTIFDWGYIPSSSESYGTTIDFGVRVSL